MTGRVHPNVSPFPTEEWTLCLFATQLSASLQPPTIKVYLSAVRSLRIERGYADPLKGCLRLQHVVKGIKRCKGSSLDRRLPITPHILRNLFSRPLTTFQSLTLRLTVAITRHQSKCALRRPRQIRFAMGA